MAERLTVTGEKKHSLGVKARGSAQISGVTEVESFDEESVVLLTDCGALSVEGEGLRVKTLDIGRGEVVVEGQINALCYDGVTTGRKGFFRR